MTETSAAARHIAEHVVMATARAIMSDDFEQFHIHQAYPQEMETYEGRKTIENKDQLKAVFEAVREYQKALGADRLERCVKTASFVDPDHIEVVYESRIFRNGKVLGSPYPSFGILRQTAESWRFIYCMYALTPTSLMKQALQRVPPGTAEDVREKLVLGAA